MDIGEDYSHLYAGEIKKHKKKIYTDGLKSIAQKKDVDIVRAQIKESRRNHSALLLRGERTDFFVTEDSKKYISPLMQKYAESGCMFVDAEMRFDSVHARYEKKYTVGETHIKQLSVYTEYVTSVVANYRAALRITLSPTRMYQVSLGGAMIIGMVSMSMIYQNLGRNVFAEGLESVIAKNDDAKEVVRVIENVDEVESAKSEEKKEEQKDQDVHIESEKKQDENTKQDDEKKIVENEMQKGSVAPVIVADIVQKNPITPNAHDKNEEIDSEKHAVKKSVDSVVKKEEESMPEKTLEELAYETVKGHPIEKMLPYILEQDPEVAKYLIAIAKQESGWGERVPVLNGQDCYNYWGYRGQRKLMGTGGHTCFNSRKDAVETVAKRLYTLIYENDRNSANKLIVWKCGSSCAGHSQDGVDRWINVVDMYHKKLSRK